jgi:hypothetical protein
VVYVEPTIKSGAAAFSMGSSTAILGLENSGTNGVTTLGMAMGKMGFSAELGFNSDNEAAKPNTGNEMEDNNDYQGEHYGLNFSMELGSLAFWTNLNYDAAADMNETVDGSDYTEQNYVDMGATFTVGNFPSGNALVWATYLDLQREDRTDETKVGNTTTTTVSEDAFSNLGLGFAAGKSFASVNNARAFWGVAADLDAFMYDEVDQPTGNRGHMMLELALAPNISMEYAFNPNWLVFGGATHTFDFQMDSYDVYAANAKVGSVSGNVLMTQQTVADMGIRYQRGIFGAEAGIRSTVFTDGPSRIFTGGNMLAGFAAILQF